VTREDRIKNECVRGSIGVASIVDKIRDNRLRRFGYVMKEERRGRPKKKWLNEIECD